MATGPTKTECQDKVWNLLILFEGAFVRGELSDSASRKLVRSLLRTAECDKLLGPTFPASNDNSIPALRQKYINFIGVPEERVLAPGHEELDDLCGSAVMEFRQQSEKILRTNLTLENKFFYHTIYRAEQTTTIVGLILGGIFFPRRFKNVISPKPSPSQPANKSQKLDNNTPSALTPPKPNDEKP